MAEIQKGYMPVIKEIKKKLIALDKDKGKIPSATGRIAKIRLPNADP